MSTTAVQEEANTAAAAAPAAAPVKKRMRVLDDDFDLVGVHQKAMDLMSVQAEAMRVAREYDGLTIPFDMFYLQYQALREYVSEADSDMNVVIACLEMMEKFAERAKEKYRELV